MPKLLQILAIFLMFASSDDLKAQITDSEASAQWLAGKIVASSGGTTQQYMSYARGLAKTLSLLSAAEQNEVLREVGIGTGTSEEGGAGGSAEGGGSGEAGGTEEDGGSVMDAINDESIASSTLLDILVATAPIDSDELNGALNRSPQMDPGDVAKLLEAYGPLSNGQMVSALTNANDNLSSATLREMILANSPVKPVVLLKVEGTSKMTEADKAVVIDANP